MIRRPPRSTQSRSSAASDVYKRQVEEGPPPPPKYVGRDPPVIDADATGPCACRRQTDRKTAISLWTTSEDVLACHLPTRISTLRAADSTPSALRSAAVCDRTERLCIHPVHDGLAMLPMVTKLKIGLEMSVLCEYATAAYFSKVHMSHIFSRINWHFRRQF